MEPLGNEAEVHCYLEGGLVRAGRRGELPSECLGLELRRECRNAELVGLEVDPDNLARRVDDVFALATNQQRGGLALRHITRGTRAPYLRARRVP